MKIILAPMEGVVDPLMREVLTAVGGIDRCVTEFIRISEQVLPPRVFYRLSPELRNGGRTACGTPVYVQLLGSDPELLAANAVTAANLGAPGIDLNFGCPAKTVNRNRGGAVLLREPRLIHDIVAAVRAAVPDPIAVTAKMRLGYDDSSLMLENALAIAEAGADELCVHARTKVEGYRPPAHWSLLDAIAQRLAIPLVANGDIFTPADYQSCRSVSGCNDVMIGRGLLQRPDLARIIAARRDGCAAEPLGWPEMAGLLQQFCQAVDQQLSARHAAGRVKQWLAYLRRHYPQAGQLFDAIKRERQVSLIAEQLAALSPSVTSAG